MKKIQPIILPPALIQALGLSFLARISFFGDGVRPIIREAVLVGILWLVALAALLVFYRLPQVKARLERIPASTFGRVSVTCLTAAILFLAISPIPQAQNPANNQAIEIQPLTGLEAGGFSHTILVQEIKADGTPLSLEELQGQSGWQMNEFGLRSDPVSKAPLLIQLKNPLHTGVTLLFGEGPQYGMAVVRQGWNFRLMNLAREERESQAEIFIPAYSQSYSAVVGALSLVFSAWAVLLALAVVIIPLPALEKVAFMLQKLTRSMIFWAAVGFMVSYVAFYFWPVFLNALGMMQLNNNLPAIYPIGNDLWLILDGAQNLIQGASPYAGANKYPPLTSLIFSSLLRVVPQEAFRILSMMNLILFILLAVFIPLRFSENKKWQAFAWLFLTAGLFTYGFHFEVERGQFNLIAIGFVFLAIILFHKSPQGQWPSYVLFCLGVQMKIYPAIFVLFFTRDWRDWKGNLSRWAGLGLVNILLLVVAGWREFKVFLAMMSGVVSTLTAIDSPVSHSITGFIEFIQALTGLDPGAARALQAGLYLTVVGLTVACLWAAVKRRKVLDPYLITACTLAALTLPSLSNDYTLAYLVGPAILLFGQMGVELDSENSTMQRLWPLAALCALAYGSTFFSYAVKPAALQNLFPPLLIMLIVTTVFSLLRPLPEK